MAIGILVFVNFLHRSSVVVVYFVVRTCVLFLYFFYWIRRLNFNSQYIQKRSEAEIPYLDILTCVVLIVQLETRGDHFFSIYHLLQ